jgi:signal transduction histidine kinase
MAIGSRLRLGLRREVLLLVPVSLLLVVILSILALFAYRNGLALLADERRNEAWHVAEQAAMQLAARPLITEEALRRVARDAVTATVIDADGIAAVMIGDPLAEPPLAPLTGRTAVGAQVVGPGGAAGSRVVAFAELSGDRTLRLDFAAGLLASQIRTQRWLFAIVLMADLGVLLLLFLFARRLLTPYEEMLDRARRLDRETVPASAADAAGSRRDPEDEMAFLLATFDRALRQLSSPPPVAVPEIESAAAAGPRSPPAAAGDELEALGRTLTSSFESGLLLLGRTGQVLALNAIGARLLSVAPSEPGVALHELLADHAALLELLDGAVQARHGVKRHECQVGERALGFTVHALRPAGGQVRGYLVLFADLTQVRREAEEGRLAESLAQLGELAAGVAHELRNSLGTLRGYLGLMERRGGGAAAPADERSDTDEYLAEMRRETDHLQRVLEDFMTFARPGTVRPRTLDLVELVRRCAADPALEGAAIEIAAAVPARLHGDPQLLERAVRNLLRNAVEAQRSVGRDGSVRAEVLVRGDEVELRVEDRGPGVSEAMRGRLFLPFATGRADGVGLGLALTHRIVTLHGGAIRHTAREGGGARFSVLLPAGISVTNSSAVLAASVSGDSDPVR